MKCYGNNGNCGGTAHLTKTAHMYAEAVKAVDILSITNLVYVEGINEMFYVTTAEDAAQYVHGNRLVCTQSCALRMNLKQFSCSPPILLLNLEGL